YRWREVYKSFLIPLAFQRDIPVQSIKYYIPSRMRGQRFNMPNVSFLQEDKNFYSVTLANVPAFRKEPFMPPENRVLSWMLVHEEGLYDLFSPSMFWDAFGKQVFEENKSRMKLGDEVRSAAATVIGDASTPEEKLKRLFEFCHSKIKNITYA